MEDKDLTEEILEKNGFKNDGTDVFSYDGNNCVVDVWYHPISIRDRHWHCQIYTDNIKYALGSALIQTVDQFNSFMKIMDADCRLLKC